MENPPIHVPYNHDLQPLEALLAGVRRPGDFSVHGTLEVPLPLVEVDGVGVLSFPVPDVQIQEIIRQAERAPYGRGGETILDTSVRQVWQLTPEKVRLGGKSWAKSFEQILSTVIDGMGCGEVQVSAELYKLLVYDEGGFFKAHRDTEKAEGMFGTLVVVLPCAHRGGELLIRHAGRQITVDLCGAEFSELAFAAFYADCEHEVRAITQGHRVCLVYNLIQQRGGKLTAPFYESETSVTAALLEKTFQKTGAPAKLAWLLAHQYSPDGLSFAGLKGEDAALGKVLRESAQRAGCAVHLGIVHIEESGPAQPEYEPRGYGRSRWRNYDDEEVEEDASSDRFEVLEVSDASQYVDQWRDAEDRAVDFGKLPLEDGEVLPAGALDDEDPDQQRLMEATGNEGASFERSYHRAAIVFWPRERFAEVLLQAGVGAVLPYLDDRVRECERASASQVERASVIRISARIIEVWEDAPGYPSYRDLGKEASRADLIKMLGRLGDAALLQRFVRGVVTRHFDGSENQALAANARLLGAKPAGELLSALARENMRLFHCACVNLLARLTCEHGVKPSADWLRALGEIGAAIVEVLPKIEAPTHPHAGHDWWRAQKARAVDAAMLAELLDTLTLLEAPPLRAAACAAVIANGPVFDPAKVIVPALATLHQHGKKALSGDAEYLRLWTHAAQFLLTRSEHPPEPPRDWRQNVTLSCNCEDCRELQAFAFDPREETHRFRVRQDRRSHLEHQIRQHGLDMTHETDRKGSPQTLVCTKTWRTYQLQCDQHKADCASMSTLLRVRLAPREETASLAARMDTAKDRRPPR